MKNKIFIAIIAVVVLSAVGVSLVTKGSFVDDLSIDNIENYYGYNVGLYTDIKDNPYFENNLTNFEELVDASELVIKAKMINVREKVTRATLTKVYVEEVLKGKLHTNEILLYEPAFFWPYMDNPNTGSYSTGGYQLMQEGREYILFLQSLKSPKGYKLSKDENSSFLPVSELYGKIPIKSNWNPEVITNDEATYKEVVDSEILTREKGSLQNYIEIKKIVEKKYH
ncbi:MULTISPECIES: hypothetical protein [unclassified Sporosarcina]|uniref:hypothetical protein n=1 Tax=unclassified Sporosarcina TaxID=2647733 RepID=UPI001A91D43C|nr:MULTISPECIES: hypothetical protein [unclassified Sporosarcina]MBO0588367.1 hypothetical protein [Sporosarcina sp. E16_8]MBO0603726.1 hypothetical protein [Sporosarcina sp. E16_3]